MATELPYSRKRPLEQEELGLTHPGRINMAHLNDRQLALTPQHLHIIRLNTSLAPIMGVIFCRGTVNPPRSNKGMKPASRKPQLLCRRSHTSPSFH